MGLFYWCHKGDVRDRGGWLYCLGVNRSRCLRSQLFIFYWFPKLHFTIIQGPINGSLKMRWNGLALFQENSVQGQ